MIRVSDVAFVRFRAPDLEQMARFLDDFGLEAVSSDSDHVYARGSDPEPWIHHTERGPAGFAGVGFDAACEADLEAAAKLPGASAIEPLDGPGGGQRVRFSDPDGHPVEVVYGRAPAEAVAPARALPYNTGAERRRLNRLQRVERGPARVKRLGHCVVRVKDYRESHAWYTGHFGFRSSDDVYVGQSENLILSFLRCDRGDVPVDHHSLLCIGVGEPGFDHAAFEVEDIDAVMLGHEHLAAAGYQHHAGIGRHVLGSQVFDYWKDPFGHVLEHFTDGDLLDASVKPGLYDPAVALGTQWGKFG